MTVGTQVILYMSLIQTPESLILDLFHTLLGTSKPRSKERS